MLVGHGINEGGWSTDATSHAARSAGWAEVVCDFGVGTEGVRLHEGKSVSFSISASRRQKRRHALNSEISPLVNSTFEFGG